jgi:putative PEP-CTERM system histidine kinase
MNDAVLLDYASAILAAALALYVAWIERRSLSHWVFVAGMLTLAAGSVCVAQSMLAVTAEQAASWQIWNAISSAFLPGFWLLFSLTYARGGYREFLVKWRLTLIVAFALPLALAFGFPGRLLANVELGNQSHLWHFTLTPLGVGLKMMLLLGVVGVLMNLESTLRASVGTMRWQIKFMILGLFVLFVVNAYTLSQFVLFSAIDPRLQTLNAGALFVACCLIPLSLARAGHFSVNVYPSRSVIQNSLVLLLTAAYLVIVGLFAKVVARLGIPGDFTLVAFLVLLSIVGLAVLLFSERLRMQTRRFISRHFQRPLYDYRTVWRSFTVGLAARVEQAELCRAGAKLVADLFQVLSVTIWLADEQREKLAFGASTSLTEAKGQELCPRGEECKELLRALRARPDPIDIDNSKETWTASLRRCHPAAFQRGGNRASVPLVVGDDILGIMTVGDRVGDVPFSHEDFDLLKCIGDQVAANLRNLQLSQKLLQTKELEAFQTMSAFFVHDLKNTASTLNLMLKNLPVHFDDPAFREDALRGISKTVNHINNLIGRLSQLRHDLQIQARDTDLNQVVTKALTDWKQVSEVTLVRELRPLPKAPLDQDQILKVVVNLVLNASEAVPRPGEIRVETSQSNGWVVLSVADNGCGMSPEFLNRSLFRPFKTSKKSGLGIGMFQSKMIVEAHGGRIEVQSEVGKGTTFRVLLPLQTPK